VVALSRRAKFARQPYSSSAAITDEYFSLLAVEAELS
jgi:hypothetical protein